MVSQKNIVNQELQLTYYAVHENLHKISKREALAYHRVNTEKGKPDPKWLIDYLNNNMQEYYDWPHVTQFLTSMEDYNKIIQYNMSDHDKTIMEKFTEIYKIPFEVTLRFGPGVKAKGYIDEVQPKISYPVYDKHDFNIILNRVKNYTNNDTTIINRVEKLNYCFCTIANIPEFNSPVIQSFNKVKSKIKDWDDFLSYVTERCPNPHIKNKIIKKDEVKWKPIQFCQN
jgi:cell fate (sporulation/competence/biofilm development) regulator YmcA (YheA/YmcA/DUF963 family)